MQKTEPWMLGLWGMTLIGLFLRVWDLAGIPAGFFCDEAATGYNAWTLLRYGSDEYKRIFPLFFESFGNWRPALPFYTTVPFIGLLGLTEFATRLPAALFGTLTILVVFSLTKELTSKSSTGLLASGLLAISPWHIHLTRGMHDPTYMVFFIALSMILFLYACKRNSLRLWIFTGISFGLTFYTYYPAYLLTPAIFLLLLYVKKPWIHGMKKRIILCIGIVCAFIVPFILGINQYKIFNRLTQVSVSNHDKTTKEIVIGMGKTYINHFSPDFLFFKGDINFPKHFIKRYSVRGMGQLYLFQLPLLCIGLYTLLKHHKKSLGILIGLFLLYPVNSSFAPFADGGGPFATRSFFGVIPFTILSAVGLETLLSYWKKNWMYMCGIVLFICIMYVSLSLYEYAYFSRYNTYASDYWGWQYGAKPIMEYALAHQDTYDEIIIPDNGFNTPEIFLKFYDPYGICAQKCLVGNPKTRYRIDVKQLFFIPNTETATPELMRQFVVQDTIESPDGKTAFFIGTFNAFNQPAL